MSGKAIEVLIIKLSHVHDFQDAPREGFKEVSAETRLKQFRKSKKVNGLLCQKPHSSYALAKAESFYQTLWCFMYISHAQEALLRTTGPEPSRVPPLRGVPHGGELSTQDVDKQRRQFQDKALMMAIKSALLKKAQLQQSSGGSSTPGRRSQPETPITLLQPSSQRLKLLAAAPGSVAGSRCNATQLRLAAPAAFTGVQKTRALPPSTSGGTARGQGDFATSPDRRSKTMLALTNASNLTIPGRSADFRSEVSGTI